MKPGFHPNRGQGDDEPTSEPFSVGTNNLTVIDSNNDTSVSVVYLLIRIGPFMFVWGRS